MATAEQTREPIEAARDAYRASLAVRLEEVTDAWRRVRGGDAKAFERFWRAIHGIAGSAGTFGFWELSARAQDVQRLVEDLRKGGGLPDEQVAGGVAEALLAMGDEAGRSVDLARHEEVPEEAAAPRTVLLLPRLPGHFGDLAAELARLGFDGVVVADPGRLLAEASGTVLCVVLDLGLARELSASLSSLTARGVGLVLVAPRRDPDARLAAARLGADALLAAPPDGAELVNVLEELLSRRDTRVIRMLLVDDEPDRARVIGDGLRAFGINVTAHGGPDDALGALADGRPDILVLQLTRPGFTDLELLRALRSDRAQLDIPVVILRREVVAAFKREALRLGADDVLPADLPVAELGSLLVSRAARAAILRSLMRRDPVTGLLNRAAFEERLKAELARAWREAEPLALAILDLDHFKTVNDTFGHAAGDRVLGALARILRDRLRTSDLAARIGGDELVIILPGTKPQAACRVVDDVRRRFAESQQALSGVPCAATVSVGVACYPEQGSPRMLLDAADVALYRAKREGRNRVAVGVRQRKGSVLIVDDDEDVTSLLQVVLEGAGFEVLVAHDGLRGYEMALERHPDVVVTDLLLPRMHGFKLCRRLKKEPSTRHIPVLLLTGVYLKYGDEVRGKGCGASHYLRKPVEPDAFLSTVEALIPQPVEAAPAPS